MIGVPDPWPAAVDRSTTRSAAGSPPPSTASPALGADDRRRSTSRRRWSSGRCSTAARSSPSAPPRSATPSAAGVDGLDPTVASIIADAGSWTAVDAYRGRVPARRSARRVRGDVGRHRRARPADDADPAHARRRARRPVRRQPHRGLLTSFVNLADAACVVVPMRARRPWRAAARRPGVARRRARRARPRRTSPARSAPRRRTSTHRGRRRPPRRAAAEPPADRAGARGCAGGPPPRRATASTSWPGTVPPQARAAAGGSGGRGDRGRGVGDRRRRARLVRRRGAARRSGIGTVELADGTWEHGFICEGWALEGAHDITAFGGWRAYLKARRRDR